MARFTALFAFAIALLVGAPTGAFAQSGADCPVVDPSDGTPVELRIGDYVLRAQAKSDSSEDGSSARVAVRLVGCEKERLVGAEDGGEAAPIAGGPLVRMLNDLRVALELGSGAGEGCFRASFDIDDAARADGGPVGRDRPLALELCLPSISVGPASRPDAP